MEITIEGATPNSMVPVGEQRRVESTDLIRTLMRRGYVRRVPDEPAPVDASSVPVQATLSVDPLEVPEPLGIEPTEQDTKAVWQAWLDVHDIDWNASDTKAQLIARWEAAQE